MSSFSQSRSETDTYSESRARDVMGKVYEDLLGLQGRGLITNDRANSIRRDVLYLLDKRALDYFQLQFRNASGGEIGGLHYKVSSDGTLQGDSDSGSIDYWMLSEGTKVKLLVSLDRSSSKIEEVDQQLDDWGYGDGTALSGTSQYLKSYSKDGFGLIQSKIGEW